MSQKSVTGYPRSQFLTYSWDAPLALRWYRDAVFDGISHSVAFGALDIGVKSAHWLHYYQAPVLLPEQVDAFYGVEPKTTDRLIRYFDPQLRGDGMFWCPETHLIDAEPVLGLCWIGKPSLNFLLPPRAVLKLACWMPATINTMRALDYVDDIASAYYEPLPDPVKMSQNYRAVEKRGRVSKDRAVLIQEAQDKGIYAYAKHFGNWDSGVTWKRLLTHHERGGQFPPTREELNEILLEL
ncbi:hypothetical protein [Microcoleus sp. OTE_8_concoct_300]|uniref:hypothetical protein n=1 Tax=Microcoleus sp. OTE_8_concoct_300 TaxID=2964710 RepID=UPI00403F161D